MEERDEASTDAKQRELRDDIRVRYESYCVAGEQQTRARLELARSLRKAFHHWRRTNTGHPNKHHFATAYTEFINPDGAVDLSVERARNMVKELILYEMIRDTHVGSPIFEPEANDPAPSSLWPLLGVIERHCRRVGKQSLLDLEDPAAWLLAQGQEPLYEDLERVCRCTRIVRSARRSRSATITREDIKVVTDHLIREPNARCEEGYWENVLSESNEEAGAEILC